MTNASTNGPDPGESVVDEVRALRARLEAEAGNDLRKLAEEARRTSQRIRSELGMTVAALPSRRAVRTVAASDPGI